MGSQYTSIDIAAASPKWEDLSGNRIKLLCSYGGQFLPRPCDGQLRYVGGDTRLVTVERSITFQDFMKKLEDVFDTMSVIIKYQLPMLDVDVLISVMCDEDLQNMMDEYERYDSPRARLKAFLFPQTTPLPSVENQVSPKQRYIDAVNGVAPILVKQKIPSSLVLNVPDYSSDPECNGPTEIDCQSPMAPWMEDPPLTSCPSSPYDQNMRKIPSEGAVINSPSNMEIDLHRVQSSPNLIRPEQSNIVPVSIYNIVPNRQVLMGNNCHGRPAIMNRGGGSCTITAEGSLQHATHGAPKVKRVAYASNRTGSPLRYMTDHMNANRP